MSAPAAPHLGDIIRIAYGHRWGGCLAEVDEVKPWGCVAFVLVPRNDGEPPSQAYIRLGHGEFAILLRGAPAVVGRH